MKNRDGRHTSKRAERQTQNAGKFPFHRMAKLRKLVARLAPTRG